MDIVSVEIEKIIPYARNPRNNDAAVDKVAASIKEFGWKQPIVVDEDMVIIVGHTRYLASKKLNINEVPVLIAKDLTPQQIKAYRIADNKTAEYSMFDNDLLVLELKDLQDENYNLINTAFDQNEIAELLIQLEKKDYLKEDDECPDIKEVPNCKIGDVFELGNHRVMCGDSTNPDHMKKLMGENFSNLLFTDPPYGVGYEGITNDELKSEEFRKFITFCLKNADFYMNPGACFYIWHASTHSYEINGSIKDLKYTPASPSIVIWVKDSLVLSRGDYHPQHELCLYGWKPGAAHKRVEDRKQSTIWEYARPKRSEGHPTMKPVEMCCRAISNSSNVNDIVLDIFLGSGSTLIACEKLNRICYGMECDPCYVDVVVKRWEEYTGFRAKHIRE